MIFPVVTTTAEASLQNSGENQVKTKKSFNLKKDTVGRIQHQDSLKLDKTFIPDSKKAMLYSALLPGMGQIYNKKYWKLPLVYGSFLGCAYAISWNGNEYRGYKQAYEDWTTKNPRESWRSYLPYNRRQEDPDSWDESYQSAFERSLKNKKDFYRRYRDLSYIVSIGVYGLWILDAYVDAQLFNFDISPDISMKVEPAVFEKTRINTTSIGLQCNINF